MSGENDIKEELVKSFAIIAKQEQVDVHDEDANAAQQQEPNDDSHSRAHAPPTPTPTPISVSQVQALLCGSITRYIIQYGTSHQSSMASEIMKTAKLLAQVDNASHGRGEEFAEQLQKLYNVAGEYMFIHALNHFRKYILPRVNLMIENDVLEKAMVVQRKSGGEIVDGGGVNDCSLLDYAGRIHLEAHADADLFEYDKDFE